MFKDSFVIVDLETTGLSPTKHEIIEIGAIKVENGVIVDTMDIFVKPKNDVPYYITKITGITNEMVKSACSINEAIYQFDNFIKDQTLIAHNARFDIGFLNNNMYDCLNKSLENPYLDTINISKKILKDLPNYKLGTIAQHFNVDYEGAHRSLRDCEITLEIYNNLKKLHNSQSSFA